MKRISLAVLLSLSEAQATQSIIAPQVPCADLKAASASLLKGESLLLDAEELSQSLSIPAKEATYRNDIHLKDLPVFCRVKASLMPRPSAKIGLEIWLPAQWNGRYLQLGSGGFAGTIHHGSLAHYLKLGYAVSSTDNGHQAYDDDTLWSVGQPEKIVDFGYRAVHETSVFAQKLVGFYYGAPARYRYFNGCSDGGREALMEAQRYPEDFDGFLAGAPALRWTHGFSALLHVRQSMATIKDDPIRLPQIKAISQEALRQCDTADGLSDGIIDPSFPCRFDLKPLLCATQGSSSGTCLREAQLKVVKAIYDGPHHAGKTLVHGFQHTLGFEDGGFQWQTWFTGPTMWNAPDPLANALSYAFFGPMLYQDPKLDVLRLNLPEAVAKADRDLAPLLNATDPALAGIRAQPRKKILQYHGWADAAVPAQHSLDYFQQVMRHAKRPGEAPVDEFYRLFMVPGMGHCFTGAGPHVFNGKDNQGAPRDAEHDVQLALERWVEEGQAPDRIMATQFVDDDPAKGVWRTRPICPYPQRARWNAKKSWTDGRQFDCRL